MWLLAVWKGQLAVGMQALMPNTQFLVHGSNHSVPSRQLRSAQYAAHSTFMSSFLLGSRVREVKAAKASTGSARWSDQQLQQKAFGDEQL